MEFLAIIFILLMVIAMLAILAVSQIKMAGMNVTDFWSFIKANDILDKLYVFCIKYDNLTPQQQIIFLKEAERFSVPLTRSQTLYGRKIIRNISKF